MLELKKEVKERGEDVVIFVNKLRGRKLKFPIDTPQDEYLKFKRLGFRIFRCTICGSDSCEGIHEEETQTIDNQGESNDNNEGKEQQTSNTEESVNKIEVYAELDDGTEDEYTIILDNQPLEELHTIMDRLELEYTEEQSKEELINFIMEAYQNNEGNTSDDKEPSTEPNYDEMSLSELRELYPDIKDRSKEGFIEQIKNI